jgi:putative heme transporter
VQPTETHHEGDRRVQPRLDQRERLPSWLVVLGGGAWRLLAIGAVVYFGFQFLEAVSVVVLAVIIALFPAAILWTPVRWLEARRWPPMLATSAVMLVAGTLLVGIGLLIIPLLISGLGDLTSDLAAAAASIRDWLVEGPFNLTEEQIDSYWSSFMEQLGDGQGIASGLLGGASAAAELVTGFFLVVLTMFFVLKDGQVMTDGLIKRLPERRRDPVGRAISVAWTSISRYMRGLALVGLVDAVFIGIGLAILGVPLVLPLATLVFFGAFFPVVGAWVSGLVAVAVAFANGGLTDALIVLAIITVIQQVEGDLLLPLVFGQALQMHPLVILLAVVAGGIAFGIAGAFLFVPAVAIAISVRQELATDPDASLTTLARGRDAVEGE